jgi:hypothetical protein
VHEFSFTAPLKDAVPIGTNQRWFAQAFLVTADVVTESADDDERTSTE